MHSHYYFGAIRKTIVQFLDTMNDISIARYDENGNVQKYVKVPLKFSPKMKVWHWVNQRKNDEMLPMISAQMLSVNHSKERIGNKFHKIFTSQTPSAGIPSSVSKYLNPIPYDFTFQLNIWTLFLSDIDQVIEQILPFFNPFAFIRIKIPELNSTLELKVILESNALDETFEMDDTENRIIKWDISFVVQSYVFQNIENIGVIKKIIRSAYPNDSSWGNRKFDIPDGDNPSIADFSEATSGSLESFMTSGSGYDIDNEKIIHYEKLN